jgi:hypothetical protein
MKKILVRSLSLFAVAAGLSATVFAQNDTAGKAAPAAVKDPTPTVIAISATTSPVDLARAAVAAQGGEKFKTLKSMVLRGSADLYPPNSTQSIPGGFILVLAGDKLRIEIDARPAFSFKQIYDGQQSYSSVPGVEIPPMSKFGLSMLAKYDQSGFVVTAIPDEKKLRGFRITDGDGNVTNFYIDATTGRLVRFLIPFNNYTFGTEYEKVKEVDGVLVPQKFSQRLEMPQGVFYANYNVKDVKLNQPIGDDVFEIPN